MLADPVVDWGQLLEVAWTSLLGGVGVTAVFSVGLYGAVKMVDIRQGGQGGVAVGYAAMALVASAVVIGSVVFAIATITTK
ncbi:MAG: hypothetical protein ACR2HC_03880 [Thermoleophilaceae bacterium]